jgi:endoglucanase
MSKSVANRIRLVAITLIAAGSYIGGAAALSPLLARHLAINNRQLTASVGQAQLAAPAPSVTPAKPNEDKPTETKKQLNKTQASQLVSVRANPFNGARLYVDPDSPAKQQVADWQSSRPADAALMRKIADNSVGIWLGGWYGDIGAATRQWIGQIRTQTALPVFILYNIPIRDCGSYSAGGATSASAYRSWVQSIASASAGAKAVFILEPDALAGWDCLSDAQRQERSDILRTAIDILAADSQHYVYLDAGNARWHTADVMATRIKQIGTKGLQGVSLNVSNFLTTAESQNYGVRIGQLTGGLHAVIDTSRNGQGPAANLEWCNPEGRGLGLPPSAQNGNPIDAYLWLKYPGESDGACNGAPTSGEWWADYALGLASRAAF